MDKRDDLSTLEHQATGGGLASALGGERISLLLYHREGAKIVPLFRDRPQVVGRAWPADVVVADPSLSRQHARFTWEEGGVVVEDLGSTNGTQLGGERVERARVSPGVAVMLGSVTASVHRTEPRGGGFKGIEPHDRFVELLGDELVRARRFGRRLAVAMVRAVGRDDALVSRFVPRLRAELRDVDRLSVHGPNAVLLLLPEVDAVVAATMLGGLIRGQLAEPPLRAGLALFPDAGVSAEELIDAARASCRRASEQTPLVRAHALGPLVGEPVIESAPMRELYRLVDRVAVSELPVLVIGETGSGKELVARAIHERGTRQGQPLRAVNCGALPQNLIESELFGHERGAFTGADTEHPGLFEQAHGGTLLLDEVGELSQGAQAALLRVLETRRVKRVGGVEERDVDVRVVAATHRDLHAEVARGAFRQDLLYRLDGMTLRVPPLRERVEEIVPLASRFLLEAQRNAASPVSDIDAEARHRLETHDWPGNVRELRNVIERASVLCQGNIISVVDLPERLRGGSSEQQPVSQPPEADASAAFKERVRRYEVDLIVDALRRAGGNQTLAAKLLEMPLRTLVHKLKSYGIKKRFDAE
ncbi:MAG: FHA domain-containing protein [Deltaproteobacteria bacterium]|nr:FHA domain-containing protein [Deltaproteobacteria bacterium]